MLPISPEFKVNILWATFKCWQPITERSHYSKTSHFHKPASLSQSQKDSSKTRQSHELASLSQSQASTCSAPPLRLQRSLTAATKSAHSHSAGQAPPGSTAPSSCRFDGYHSEIPLISLSQGTEFKTSSDISEIDTLYCRFIWPTNRLIGVWTVVRVQTGF